MGACVIGGVLTKPALDTKLFTIDWSGLLDVATPAGIAVHDRIKTSIWTFDPASPASAVTLPENGFDDTGNMSWVTVSGGALDDVTYINNTITTTGACVNGKNTPSQTLVRQLRIRIADC